MKETYLEMPFLNGRKYRVVFGCCWVKRNGLYEDITDYFDVEKKEDLQNVEEKIIKYCDLPKGARITQMEYEIQES